ncbi:MAG: GGDEF domain-containing protein [Eubacterium sp.]|nr:GGDEF domain-containing protein [Eubacterium sp.]
MKGSSVISKRGISLRKLNIIMLIIAVVTSAALIFAMNRTNNLYKETHTITQDLLQWRQDSYNMKLASDYLTEEIRCFAVTGNKDYLDNYFDEAKEKKRREKALDSLKGFHRDSAAIRKLEMGMTESLNLMKIEYYSARLTIEGYGMNVNDFPEEIRSVSLSEKDLSLSANDKKNEAVSILFDHSYLTSKQRINEDMNDCLDKLEQDVYVMQNEMASKLSQQVFIEHILTFLLIGIMMGIVLFTRILVFNPLRNCVELIRKEEEIPLSGAYEVRFLAKNYNLMYYTAKETENKLNYDVNHDPMTGLFNRRGYDFFLNNVDMETSALLIIDLDHFKEVNDHYGHDVGDKVIKKAAGILLASFRSQDYVCRLGGDEFAVIMIRSDSSMKDLVCRKVELILKKLNDNSADESIPAISCSVGCAFGRVGLKAQDLFKRADSALYESKESGRGKVSFYTNNTKSQ